MDKMQIKPLYDRVVIKRLESENKTAAGIIIPDTAKEKAQYAEVIAVGPGKLMSDGAVRPLMVKEGNKVLFGKYSGTEVKCGNEEYLVIKEDEILAIITQ